VSDDGASPQPPTTARATALLLALAAFGVGLAALAYNEWFLALVAGKELGADTVRLVRRSQLGFAVLAVCLAGGAFAAARLPRVRRGLERPRVANALLVLLALVLPLALAELALQPMARARQSERTTIFQRDPELGWRLRPGVRGRWAGVEVEINAKGVRGPELPYEKPAGVRRVVWLGDSVTFGFRIEGFEKTFPFRVEPALEATTGVPIETVNGAVDGWSQWQQAGWLESEGVRYAPDLVIVGFVLNDVTEKFGLQRFGGSGEGFQLSQTATWMDEWFGRSAVLHFVRRIGARLRFGADTQGGAKREQLLDVQALAEHPERPDVREAWRVTFEELTRLFDWCDEHGVAAALVVFPFTFQFDAPERLDAPQTLLREFAAARDLPFFDLLAPLGAWLDRENAAPDALFLDEDHLTERGHAVVAELLGEFIAREQLLARRH
jgi:lysophospholipase L1-like esterase